MLDEIEKQTFEIQGISCDVIEQENKSISHIRIIFDPSLRGQDYIQNVLINKIDLKANDILIIERDFYYIWDIMETKNHLVTNIRKFLKNNRS